MIIFIIKQDIILRNIDKKLELHHNNGHQFIRNLESLKMTVRPRLDSLNRIAKALNIDIKQLFDEIEG